MNSTLRDEDDCVEDEDDCLYNALSDLHQRFTFWQIKLWSIEVQENATKTKTETFSNPFMYLHLTQEACPTSIDLILPNPNIKSCDVNLILNDLCTSRLTTCFQGLGGILARNVVKPQIFSFTHISYLFWKLNSPSAQEANLYFIYLGTLVQKQWK